MTTYKVKVSCSIDWSEEVLIEADTYTNDHNNNLVFLKENGSVIKVIHAEHWFSVE